MNQAEFQERIIKKLDDIEIELHAINQKVDKMKEIEEEDDIDIDPAGWVVIAIVFLFVYMLGAISGSFLGGLL